MRDLGRLCYCFGFGHVLRGYTIGLLALLLLDNVHEIIGRRGFLLLHFWFTL